MASLTRSFVIQWSKIMDGASFDALSRILGHVPSRRALFPLLGSMLAGPTFAILPAEAKKKKKKKATLCLDGQTIQASKKKKKKLLKSGATPGECPPPPPPCTPGSCGAGALCDGGVCQPCTVTCDGNGVRCGLDLQAALDQGGTVYACPGRYVGNLAIKTNVVLFGAGDSDDPAANTILDANQTEVALNVNNTSTVKLQQLRITGGNTDGIGGGIVNSGNLTLTACTVTRNTAFGGGGIWHIGGTNPLALNDCIVSENTADFTGGGLFVSSGPVTITGSAISQNVAGGGGGGLYNTDGAVTFDSACRVTGNTATDEGGGILINGTGTVALNGALVTGNSSPQCVGVFCP